MITSGTSFSSPFLLPPSFPFKKDARQLIKPSWAQKEKSGGDHSQAVESTFSIRLSRAMIARSAVAVFGLGFLDAGYSGDWSLIGAISKETEELLKSAAYLVAPLCLLLIFFGFDGDRDSEG
ncbi:hypothetical protein Cni_G06537 [Canna indica]|uniref:DUF7887 domain-containing protein n=1 Tax=Canna indica TaxID=4628 RepID=A0AAQ3JYU8_9LILI|nr:hypothetical protein Cni_G06537 [Canna indica]